MKTGGTLTQGFVAISPAVLSIGEQIAIQLGERIIFGEFMPGQRLTEESVQRWTFVSRSPVREAFRLMEKDGLVRRETNRGVTVTAMDFDHMDDIYRMRVALEAQAAGLAASRAGPGDIVLLEQGLQRLEAALNTGDLRAYFRENLNYIASIHVMARAEKLQEILHIIGRQAMRFRFLAHQRPKRSPTHSLAGAAQVCAAIRNGDPARAAAVTAAVIQSSWDEIRAALTSSAIVSHPQTQTAV